MYFILWEIRYFFAAQKCWCQMLQENDVINNLSTNQENSGFISYKNESCLLLSCEIVYMVL